MEAPSSARWRQGRLIILHHAGWQAAVEQAVVQHRIIGPTLRLQDFMIQMGDPTGTGKGGESIWGGKFEDEINSELKVRDTK